MGPNLTVSSDGRKRGRGRPPRGASHNLRERLIEAAHATVVAHGAARLSLRQLAAELEVSPSAYLHHFAGPEEIIGEVACRGFEELVEALQAGVGERSGAAAVMAAAEAYVGFGVSRGRLYRTMFSRLFARGLAEAQREVERGEDAAGVAEAAPDLTPTRRSTARLEELFHTSAFRTDVTGAVARRPKPPPPESPFDEPPPPDTPRNETRRDRRSDFFHRLYAIKDRAWRLLVTPFIEISDRPRDAGLAFAALLHGLVGEFIDEGLFADAELGLYAMTPERAAIIRRSVDLFLNGAAPGGPVEGG